MSFLGEIKRRKVFQVAAVYAVTALLLQHSSAAFSSTTLSRISEILVAR